MPPLISQLTYGRVSGYLFAMVGDGSDADALPEQMPISGQAIFTAPFKSLALAGVGIGVPSRIVVNILNGVLTDAGQSYVSLVANDIPLSSIQGFAYTVEFKNLTYTDNDGTIVPTTLDPFQIKVPTWNSSADTVKLQDAIPVSNAGGTPIIRGAQGAQGPSGVGVVPGGVTGQGIVKFSSIDGDYGWGTVSGGAQGPAGPTGATGATGPKGDTGATGATGAASTVAGPKGDKGDTGAAGVDSLANLDKIEVLTSTGTVTLAGADVAGISLVNLTAATNAITLPAAPSATGLAAKSKTVVLVQDATGGRLVTWPATVQWDGGITPVFNTTAGKRAVVTLICIDGTNWLGFVGGVNF